MTLKTKFISYFEGYFDNQAQAFHQPREFALIELNHTKLSASKFRVSQRYIIDQTPYRQAIVEVTQKNGNIILKSYEDTEEQSYKSGCDIIFEYDEEEDKFHGVNVCNDCFVQKGEYETYLQTEAFLGNNYYTVVDKGLDVNSNEQRWGSKYGYFNFDRK